MEVNLLLKDFVLGSSIACLVFLALVGYEVFPLLLFGGMIISFYFLIGKKGMLKNQFKEYTCTVEVGFDEIGGQKTAKQELKEALDFIIHSDNTRELGIRPLKGILLTGPPGTGKTLLAKAAAQYTDAIFLTASGSEFVEMYAGVGAQRVRKLFQSAKGTAKSQKKDRAIVFIDEIEVLGGKRGSHSSHLEYDQTLNQLLVEMDGLKSDEDVRVLLIAATNRGDMLDEALLRPGRFDRQVKVPFPSKEGRKEILLIHSRNKPMDVDVDMDKIARDTFGFSGAHLESVINEAAIMAFRNKKKIISQVHLMEAVDKVMLGEKMDRKPTQEELRRVAVHETGHAIISELLEPGSVSHLTITPRGNALGYMRQSPKDDQYLFTKIQLEQQIQVCLAGAQAEMLILHDSSTGAGNDYQQAVKLAHQIIASGLSRLGVIDRDYLSRDKQHRILSEIIEQQTAHVESALRVNRQTLIGIYEKLMKDEYVSGDDLRQLINKKVS